MGVTINPFTGELMPSGGGNVVGSAKPGPSVAALNFGGNDTLQLDINQPTSLDIDVSSLKEGQKVAVVMKINGYVDYSATTHQITLPDPPHQAADVIAITPGDIIYQEYIILGGKLSPTPGTKEITNTIASMTAAGANAGDGINADLTLTFPNEGTDAALYLKIIDYANGGDFPSEDEWDAAAEVTVDTDVSYGVTAVGNRDIAVRVYGTSGFHTTHVLNVNVAEVSETHKISLGEANSTYEGTATDWANFGADAEATPVAILDINGADNGMTLHLDETLGGNASKVTAASGVTSGLAEFPAAVFNESLRLYDSNWATEPGTLVFSGLDNSKTYTFAVLCHNTLAVSGYVEAKSDNVNLSLVGATTDSDSINPIDNLSVTVNLAVQPSAGVIKLQWDSGADWEYPLINAIVITKS